jgi:hypothetical protein
MRMAGQSLINRWLNEQGRDLLKKGVGHKMERVCSP